MSDLQEFREEVRGWLAENAPESLRGRPSTDIDGVWGGRKWEPSHPDERVWLERMGARGWTAPTWPAEYGGGGLSKEEAKVLAEEMKAIEMPPALIGFGRLETGGLGTDAVVTTRSFFQLLTMRCQGQRSDFAV